MHVVNPVQNHGTAAWSLTFTPVAIGGKRQDCSWPYHYWKAHYKCSQVHSYSAGKETRSVRVCSDSHSATVYTMETEHQHAYNW